MTKCSVRWCKNYSGGNRTVSFHLFPRDPSRKRKWVEAVRRDDTWIPTKHSAICSIHFETACFNTNVKKQRKLEKDAVPTLFLPIYSQEVNSDQGVVVLAESPSQEDGQLVQKTGSNQVQVLDSPRNLRLRKKIHEQTKKIKRLQYINRCLRKRVTTIEEILNSLKEKNLITENDSVVLEKFVGKTKDLLKRMK